MKPSTVGWVLFFCVLIVVAAFVAKAFMNVEENRINPPYRSNSGSR